MRHKRHPVAKTPPTDHNSQLCIVCGKWTPYGFGPPGWLKSIWACPAHLWAAERLRVAGKPPGEGQEPFRPLPPFWPR